MNDEERLVFNHSPILEYYKAAGEYAFYIDTGNDPVKITVRIYENQHGEFTYMTSHLIQTPEQMSPYSSSRRIEKTAEAALAKAIDDIMHYYTSANDQGHAPSPNWFVPAVSF